MRAASEAGAKYIFANPLFLKPCSAAVFMPFLEQNFPALVEHYRTRYAERAFLPKGYGQRLSQLMAALRRKYGFGGGVEGGASEAHPNQQLGPSLRNPVCHIHGWSNAGQRLGLRRRGRPDFTRAQETHSWVRHAR